MGLRTGTSSTLKRTCRNYLNGVEIRTIIPEEGLITNKVRREGELDIRGVKAFADATANESKCTMLENLLAQILHFIEQRILIVQVDSRGDLLVTISTQREPWPRIHQRG